MTTTALPLDERQQRGLIIAATASIKQNADGVWVVPSQSQKGKYRVDGSAKTCSCPDFESRQKPCKHVFAVEFVQRRETTTRPNGDVTVVETTGVKVTYGQDWSAYNRAQTTEKDHFFRLLRDLVASVPTPEQKGAGRRFIPLADMIFSAAFKVYSGYSGRRFMSDMRDAEDKGYVSHAPSYNSIFNVLANDTLTPILLDLITIAAKPLASVEEHFAVDSTGIGTQCFYRHYSMKYGKGQTERREYLKLHAIVGTKTNIIAACKITDRETDHGDVSEFKPLVEAAADHFTMKEISADLAYSTYANLQLADAIGAAPYIPFKSNAQPTVTGHRPQPPAIWTKLYHYFQLNREEFLAHYHRRSNVETCFSMIKKCIGDTLRSKTRTAQHNEALLMVLCHNIRCLIHEMFELGIVPVFEKFCPAIPGASGDVITVAQQLTDV